MTDYLTPNEAAEYLRVSRRSFQRISRKLTKYRPTPRRVLFAQGELDDYLTAAAEAPRSPSKRQRQRHGVKASVAANPAAAAFLQKLEVGHES